MAEAMRHTVIATCEACALAAAGVIAAGVLVITILVPTGRGTLP
jgi:hypothetical protein